MVRELIFPPEPRIAAEVDRQSEDDRPQIPRRKTSWGGEGGPLVIPPGAQHIPGEKTCATCGRLVAREPGRTRKGSCKCLYYRRTTTFIDVLQDEFLLKMWGNRNVAYGMSQRPDLVLQASSCGPDKFGNYSEDSKRELNIVAAEAQREAGDKVKATIGTSLHRLTHKMDRGDTLGRIPDRWQDDLRAYDQKMSSIGVEWVSIEAFRVLDEWVTHIRDCDHRARRYGGKCDCFGVAGTVDRIGWYKGRLRVFDVKTGSDFNKTGHAMQLAAYAHMVPYQFPGDKRTRDIDEVDTSVGYIIYLPEGKGECRIEAMDLEMGWRHCQLAKLIWEARETNPVVDADAELGVVEMAAAATTLEECRNLWKTAASIGAFTDRVERHIFKRVEELKARGVKT